MIWGVRAFISQTTSWCFYAGHVCRIRDLQNALLTAPSHPYTEALLSAVPCGLIRTPHPRAYVSPAQSHP